MQRGAGGRSVGKRLRVVRGSLPPHGSLFATALALAVSTLTAGCATDGQPMASIFGGSSAAVAFDTIDGPPVGVFQKLVQKLDAEAQARQIAVVPHDNPAQYRIRTYLAASVTRGETAIAWVWDVYDSEERRRLRITGEEPAGRVGRNAWAGANDVVLERIARNGMERLAAFLTAPGAEPPARSGEIAVAGLRRDDFSPESWGIFQILTAASSAEPTEQPATDQTAEVPLPRRRPALTASVAPAGAMAFAPPDR